MKKNKEPETSGKFLYLMRHAKSSWDNSEWLDFERPLNIKGRADAPLMGNFLKQKNVEIQQIISSPANRALTTARLFSEEFGFDLTKIQVNEKIFEASVDDILQIISNLQDSVSSAMLIGHNPAISLATEKLTGIFYSKFPTAAIVAMRFNTTTWAEATKTKGEIVFFENPKKIRGTQEEN